MSFNKCVDLCNLHESKIRESFRYLPDFFLAFVINLHTQQQPQETNLLSVIIVLPVLELHVSRIKQHVLLCLVSFTQHFFKICDSSMILYVTKVYCFFYGVIVHCMCVYYHHLLTHLHVNKYVGCFQFGAVLNKDFFFNILFI